MIRGLLSLKSKQVEKRNVAIPDSVKQAAKAIGNEVREEGLTFLLFDYITIQLYLTVLIAVDFLTSAITAIL
nr:MAG: hypothetical protein EDM05_09280 [Leptolyngbya sp. IPPAS B-1204]